MAGVLWTLAGVFCFILVPNLCVLVSEGFVVQLVVVVVVVVFLDDVDVVGKADFGGNDSCSILGSVVPWAGVGRVYMIV